MTTPEKFVYAFGSSRTEGTAAMKNLLGGKGANLAEMCRLGLTVPSGFTISTEACTAFTAQGREAGGVGGLGPGGGRGGFRQLEAEGLTR